MPHATKRYVLTSMHYQTVENAGSNLTALSTRDHGVRRRTKGFTPQQALTQQCIPSLIHDIYLGITNAVIMCSWTEVSRAVGTRNPDRESALPLPSSSFTHPEKLILLLKECAKRWQHFLDPELNHSEWTPYEDQLLVEEVEKNGRNWARIGEFTLHGRSATDAKNRYLTHSHNSWTCSLKLVSM
jgi:hypothetical protein